MSSRLGRAMGKRFHTMISFNPDTGLKELLDKVIDYTLLMKDFQIKELLTADPLPLISTDITTIFQHLMRLCNIPCTWPIVPLLSLSPSPVIPFTSFSAHTIWCWSLVLTLMRLLRLVWGFQGLRYCVTSWSRRETSCLSFTFSLE